MLKLSFFIGVVLVAILLSNYDTGYGQQNNHWCFGHKVGFNFNVSPVQPYVTGMMANCSAAVSDENGQLLFYTNGDEVYNSNHQLMPNGAQLIVDPLLPPSVSIDGDNKYISGRGPINTLGWLEYGSTVIAPVPGSRYRYYIFSLMPFYQYPYAGRLYYSIVNMELDGGLGDVEVTNKCVLLDSGLVSRGGQYRESPLEAIIGEHCDIWLLGLKQSQQQGTLLLSYNITAEGIAPAITSPLGIGGGSDFRVSPRRTHVAFTYNAMLYDFDPAAGIVTSPGISLLPQSNSITRASYYRNVEFSADGSKLYFGRGNLDTDFQFPLNPEPAYQYGIFQYDLNAEDIMNSRFWLENSASGNMRLGPDGRIYINELHMLPFLYGSITNPNASGIDCNLTFNNPVAFPGTYPTHEALPKPVPVIPYDTITGYYTLSTPACTPLAVYPTDTSGWAYLWSDGSTGDSLVVVQEGTYQVQYFTSPCTYRIDSFEVRLIEVPVPSLGNDTVFCYGDGIEVLLTAPEGEHLQFLWNTGSTENSMTARDSGLYWLQVQLGDCMESDTIQISRMQCQCYVGMPNAFTPNGDGINDRFIPVINPDCPGAEGYFLHVYNRFGQRIYSSVKPGEGWDGTHHGTPVDAGTYFYEMGFVNQLSGQKHQKQGDITLIR